MRYATVQEGPDHLYRVSDSSYRYGTIGKPFAKKKSAIKVAGHINEERKLAERKGAVRNPVRAIKALMDGRNLAYSPK